MPDPDRYNRAAKQYQLTADLKKVKIGNQTLGEILLKKLRPKDQTGPFGVFHNHHMFDITENFWDTEPPYFTKLILKFVDLKHLLEKFLETTKRPHLKHKRNFYKI